MGQRHESFAEIVSHANVSKRSATVKPARMHTKRQQLVEVRDRESESVCLCARV